MSIEKVRVMFCLGECVVPDDAEHVRLPSNMFPTGNCISIQGKEFPKYHWSMMTVDRPDHPQIDLILDIVRKRLDWELLEGTHSNTACRTLSKAEPNRDYVEVAFVISCIMSAHIEMTESSDTKITISQ